MGVGMIWVKRQSGKRSDTRMELLIGKRQPVCFRSTDNDDEMCDDVDHCVMYLKRRRYREG